jgi:adenylate cyclase
MKFVGPHPPAIGPPSFLAGTDQVGFTDIIVDADGGVRRGLLYLSADRTIVSSLALRLALIYLAADGIVPQPDLVQPAHLRLGSATLLPLQPGEGGYVGADTRGYQVMLDFPGAGSTFHAWRVTALTRGDVPASAIEGKVVLIGVTADSVPDTFFTPQSRSAGSVATRGLVLHARMVSQLLAAAIDGRPPIAAVREAHELGLLVIWSLLGATAGLWARSPFRLLCASLSGVFVIAALGAWALAARWWLPVVPPALAWPLAASGVTAYRVGQERRQRAVLMRLFRSHLSPDVADAMWRQRHEFLEHGRVRPQRLTATVLFADIRGFAALSEKLDPRPLQDWLDEFLSAMAQEVMRHGGVIDKYIGDAVMAVFGVPIPRTSAQAISQDAVNAVDAALAMEQRLVELNIGWEAGRLPTPAMRIGIFTGPVVAGSLGPTDRLEFTVIGDAVNTASRLESAPDECLGAAQDGTQCRILIGEATMRCLDGQFDLQEVGMLPLKGKNEQVRVYRVTGRSKPAGNQVRSEE